MYIHRLFVFVSTPILFIDLIRHTINIIVDVMEKKGLKRRMCVETRITDKVIKKIRNIIAISTWYRKNILMLY